MNYLLNKVRGFLDYFQLPIEPYILLADRPMHHPGVIIRKCYAHELQYHFGFQYCEEPNYVSLSEIINDPQPIAKKIHQRLKQPLCRQLVLCPNHVKGDYGVFTRAPLPAGTLIGIYTGIITRSRTGDTDYLLALSAHHATAEGTYAIDAKTEGGITRFIQHFPNDTRPIPDKEALSNPKLQAAIEAAQVVTANIDGYYVTINQKSLCFFVSNRAIQAGEQLGISYGLHYWTSREIQPCYFNKNGDVVELSRFNQIEE